MALKIRIPRLGGQRPWASLFLRVGLLAFAALALVFIAVFGFYYVKYGHVVDERMNGPIFANTAKIFAAPREVKN